MKRFLSLAVLLFLPLLLLTLVFMGYHFFHTSYDDFLDTTLKSIEREDLRGIVKEKYFTAHQFYVVQKVGVIFSVLSLLCLVFFIRSFIKCLYRIECGIEKLWLHVKDAFEPLRDMNALQKLSFAGLLLFVLLRSVYYASHFYIQYDEAWNYNYFLRKNLLLTFFAHNNYPLHNVITFLVLKITPDNTFFLRLPVMMLGLIACVSVFIIFRKIWNEIWIALLGVALFMSLPVSIFYMLYARGVMLNMVLLIWIVYVGWRYLKDPQLNSLKGWVLLNILGTFSILTHPLFILFQGVILIVMIRINPRDLSMRKTILFFGLSCAGSVVVFLPFLLGSGINFLSSSNGISIRYDLPYHSYSVFYGGAWWAFYLLLLLHVIFLFLKEMREYYYFIFLNLSLLLAVPLLYFVWGVYFPERALPFLFIPVLFGFGLFCRYVSIHQVSRKWVIGSTLILCLFLQRFAHQSKYLNWSKELDHQVFLLSEKLREKKIHSLYNTSSEFNYFVPGLSYYSSLKSYPLQYYTNQPRSSRYNLSMANHTDAIVVQSHDSLPYPVLFRLEDLIVYLKQ